MKKLLTIVAIIIVSVLLPLILIKVYCTTNLDDALKDTIHKLKVSIICIRMHNPYTAESKEYLGYEWAKTTRPYSCDQTPEGFAEGCLEYEDQFVSHANCAIRMIKGVK